MIIYFKYVKYLNTALTYFHLNAFLYIQRIGFEVYKNTSVTVPSKMMASKKKHLVFYCTFIYFTFNNIYFLKKKILKIKRLILQFEKLDTGLPIIIRR